MGLQSLVKEANLNLPSSMLLAFLSGYLCSERQWLVAVDSSVGYAADFVGSRHQLSSILMVTAVAEAAMTMAATITTQMGEHSRHPIPSTTAAAV